MLKEALGTPESHWPAIATLISEGQTQLDSLLQDLDRGLAKSVEASVNRIEASLKRSIPAGFADMGTAITQQLNLLGAWPDTAIDDAGKTLSDRVAAVLPPDIQPAVAESLVVALSARIFFVRTVCQEVVRMTDLVVSKLALQREDPALAAVLAARADLLGENGTSLDEPPYVGIGKSVQALRAALRALIESATPAALEQPGMALLDAGSFVVAAQAIVTAAAARSMLESYGSTDGPSAARVGQVDYLSPPVLFLVAEQTTAPSLRIISPLEARVGQAVETRAFAQSSPANLTFEWSAIQGLVSDEKADKDRYWFVPAIAGSVLIQCRAFDAATGFSLSTTVAIQIASTAEEQAVLATQSRIDRREIVISLISGIFIAAAGTMIFSDNFIGTMKDFFFAALWGFSADVSVSRLRTIAEPLSSRQLPTA